MTRFEVPLAQGEVPSIPSIPDFASLQKNVGSFALDDYGCVLDKAGIAATAPDSLIKIGRENAKDTALVALEYLLAKEFPELRWWTNDPALIPREQRSDKGFHHDYDETDDHNVRLSPGTLVVGYHDTLARWGSSVSADVEIAFGSPTDDYVPAYSNYLAELLDKDQTNNNLVVPSSIRKVRLEEGGTVAFTHKRPEARAQLHRFRTHSSGVGESFTWSIFGYEY